MSVSFIDVPSEEIKRETSAQAKIPDRLNIGPGFPDFIPGTQGRPFSTRAHLLDSGRSPGFPTASAAFPSRFAETVAHAGRRAPFRSISKGWGYSGGPAPDFNGVPY